MIKLVNAYNTNTGEKLRVPEHWLDHPKLGVGLARVPSEASKQPEDGTMSAEPVTATDPGKKTKTKEAGNAEDHR